VQSTPGLSYTYWRDLAGTVSLEKPNAIDASGTYFIKGVVRGGCAKTVPVSVTVGTPPVLSVTSAVDCGKVDITSANVIIRSEPGLAYTYWSDPAASVDLPSARAITATGNYYLKATNPLGCSTIKTVQATVNPFPAFATTPITVTYPATADLTSSITSTGAGTLTYSFWKDQRTTQPVATPKKVDVRGTYYVRAKNEFGCITDQPVTVTILAPPDPKIVAPTAFSPNRDGINDLFRLSIVGEVVVKNIKVFNRWGQMVFTSIDINKHWDGTYNGQTLPVGTYYWVFEGIDRYKEINMVSSGSITMLK
jgi:gliding motility-associated-like protein